MIVKLLTEHHLMRNARFGPLTLLMTLRVIDVKSGDKFTRLFYVKFKLNKIKKKYYWRRNSIVCGRVLWL